MAVSALQGVFREFTLTYQKETGSWTTDQYGNPVPETEDATLVVNFEPSKSKQVIFQEGADPHVVKGTLTCIDPSELPAEVGIGKAFSVTYAGKAGTLTILQASLDPLEVLDEVLGQQCVAQWVADA